MLRTVNFSNDAWIWNGSLILVSMKENEGEKTSTQFNVDPEKFS